jgi:hypothetical protein
MITGTLPSSTLGQPMFLPESFSPSKAYRKRKPLRSMKKLPE